ncbi:hypothetical protein O6H91_20G075500 [Diphasiastrum complanatum]|uniref:Uncharacterized protein n=1 Tax=Diphasiastrum complanatum TaxID=34168 RepID=A0ACC2ATA2_DIPCM|nr:hypothetical protein O6H91_20G075500 [Diphasiastrum complanatum]
MRWVGSLVFLGCLFQADHYGSMLVLVLRQHWTGVLLLSSGCFIQMYRGIASFHSVDSIGKMAEEADPWIERDREAALFHEFSGVPSPGIDASRSWVGSDRHPHLEMQVGCEEMPLSVKASISGACTMDSSEEGDALQREKSEGDVEVADMDMGEEFKSLEYITSANEKVENRVYRQGAWSEAESKILYDAKKREKEFLSGLNKKSISADEKWKAIGEFCWSHGVQRSKEQCKFKWENSLPEYRRVKAFEKERSPGTKSYFEMEKKEKRAWRLPRNLNKELYYLLSSVIEGESVVAADNNKPNGREQLLDAALAVGNAGGEIVVGELNGRDGRGDESAPQKSERAEEEADKEGKEKGTGVHVRKRPRKEDRVKIQQSKSKHSQETNGLADLNRKDGTPAAILISEQRGIGMEIVKVDPVRACGYGLCNNSSPVNLNSREKEAAAADALTADEIDHKKEKQSKSDILFRLEDRKDARHKEIVAVEREKLAVISSVASALNNVALAMQKVAELFHHC